MTDAARAAGEIIRRLLPEGPRLGLILGSGLGALAGTIEAAAALPYADLPGFPAVTITGHEGRLILGRLGGQRIACLSGRAHLYEGQGLAAMMVPIRALKSAGAEILILTNAAGSLRPEIGPGRLAAISDHLNLLPGTPLIGPNDDSWGPRFFSLADAYDAGLRGVLAQTAASLDIAWTEGVYLACPGPNFETPAEIRMMRGLGADLVGMSTVPEVIIARHCGLRVAAISVVTNLAEGLSDLAISHEQVMAHAAIGAAQLTRLLPAFLQRLA